MSCCGGTYRVKKFVVNSQYKQQLPKNEVKEDDIILANVAQRKLFKCKFNLNQIINPHYMAVATVDYTKINSAKEQILNSLQPLMIRQQSQQQMRENEVRFQSEIKQIIRSKAEIVKSDSDKRQIDERDIDLKVIDQNQKNNKTPVKVKPMEREREMMIA